MTTKIDSRLAQREVAISKSVLGAVGAHLICSTIPFLITVVMSEMFHEGCYFAFAIAFHNISEIVVSGYYSTMYDVTAFFTITETIINAIVYAKKLPGFSAIICDYFTF